MYHSALENHLLGVEIGPASPGAGSTNGAGVDMQGWDGVAFVAAIGVVGNGGTYDLRVVESANANFSGAVNVSGAAITQVPNTSPNICVTIDVYRPTNRYLRVVSTVATNNVNVAVTSFRYRGQSRLPKSLPTNHQYIKVAAN